MAPGLEDELAEEYGTGVKVEIVSGATEGSPTQGSASSEDPPAKAEGDQTAKLETEVDDQAGTAGATGDEDDEELTEEDTAALERLDTFLEEERTRIRKEVEEEIVPRVQSGLDRQVAALKEENQRLQIQQDEFTRQIREQSIAQLTPEQQAEMRAGWANEDKAKEASAYADDLVAYHDELDIYRLSLEYGEFGVTAEELVEIDADKREVYCKDKEIAWLREHPAGSSTQKTNGTQTKAKAEQPARKPAPAGARAPSDVGRSAPPAPQSKQVEGKGLDAMAANLSDRDTWESVSFGKR